MPGVGAMVGIAAGVAVPGPAGGTAEGWAAAGAVAAGVLAGACAAAGVSQIAANAIAHPIRLISTPGNMLEPENAEQRLLRLRAL
jgi:hypothetical protein